MSRAPLLLLCLLFGAFQAHADAPPAFDPVPQPVLLQYLGGKGVFELIDARSAEEYASGHVWGAVNVPHDSDLKAMTALPEDLDRSVVLYCKTGKRANALKQRMLAMGYTDVKVLSPVQMMWAGELPVFNCAVTDVEAAITTAARPLEQARPQSSPLQESQLLQ